MNIGPPAPIKDPNLFAQNISSFINLAAPPPPPPPPPVAIEQNYNIPHQMNHLPPPQAPAPFHGGGPPNVQQPPMPAPAPFLSGGPPNIQQQPPIQPQPTQPPFEGKTFRNKQKNVCQIGDIIFTLSTVWTHTYIFFLFQKQTKQTNKNEKQNQILETNDQVVDGVLCSFFRKQLSKRKSNESQLRKY